MSYIPPDLDARSPHSDPYIQRQQVYAKPSSTVTTPPRNGLALAAMIVGIIAIPAACCAFPGVILGAAAAIMGHVGTRQVANHGQHNRSHALTGVTCGWIGAGLGLLNVVIGLALGFTDGILGGLAFLSSL
ncbi:DUF4190 domain-containing protein [Catellatospora sp. NPDC049609]|uniref:DUF4190 domain-containing protein n=1 Tax=Catellatospora sp. NPDC049609 TaxID=3155505 RepID=UPI0034397152